MDAVVQILYNRRGKRCKWCTSYTRRFNNLHTINEGICSAPIIGAGSFKRSYRPGGIMLRNTYQRLNLRTADLLQDSAFEIVLHQFSACDDDSTNNSPPGFFSVAIGNAT